MNALGLFLFIFCFAEPEELAPVQVIGEKAKMESSRSVKWPVKAEKVTPAIQLPQPEDALNATSGLQVRTQGSPTFSIRGSAQSGRALVLYDHIPLNFASGLGVPRIFLAKENLAELNVIKGPASLFYGSQAMSGAVDFISKKYQRPELNVNFSDTNESFVPWRDGDLGHQSYHLGTPLLQNSSTHLQSSFFYEDDDGQFPYQINSFSGVRGFNSQNTSRMTFKGAHQQETWRLDFNAIMARQIQQSPGAVNFPYVTRSETEGVLVSASPHFFFGESHSLKQRLSYLQSDADFLDPMGATVTKQKTFILQNEWVYDLKSHSKLQFFADAFFHELDNSFVAEGSDQENYELGPFYSFRLFENLSHQVGGRYLINQEKFLPTLATHYFFLGLDSWVSYSEGFRNPTLSDLYSNAPFFVGNPDLEPEKSQQYELGIKNQNNNFLSWDLRFFHIEYSEFIEGINLSPTLFSRTNLGEGYSRGADLDFLLKQSLFDWQLGYNYLDTKARRENRPFRLAPRHQLTLGGTFKAQKYHLQVQNTHWYKVFDLSGNQVVPLPNWQQWNFFAHLFLAPKSRVSLGLINAFNEGKELTLNYPEPQRQYWLQFHQQF